MSEIQSSITMPLINPSEGRILVLTRHGTSDGNAEGRWTGLKDVPLAAPKGFEDAVGVGRMLRKTGIVFDRLYTSRLQRARQTSTILEQELGFQGFDREVTVIPSISTPLLNERDFGEFTGWKKSDVRDLVGEEQYQQLRRGSWATRMPGGQSLEDVYDVVAPYLEEEIMPQVISGKNVLFVAHSNVVRVALKDIHDLHHDKETFQTMEVNHGEAHVVQFDADGDVLDHDILPHDAIVRRGDRSLQDSWRGQ